MTGPLSRFLQNHDQPPDDLRLFRAAVESKWDLPPEKLEKIKELLATIATNPRMPSRAIKAAHILHKGMRYDDQNRHEMMRLIMEDEAVPSRPAPIHNQVNIASSMPIDQVHEVLGIFAPQGPAADTIDTQPLPPPEPLDPIPPRHPYTSMRAMPEGVGTHRGGTQWM